MSYGDPFRLLVEYSESDFEFLLDFNYGDETTSYSVSDELAEIELKSINGSGGMDINFVGVAPRGT